MSPRLLNLTKWLWCTVILYCGPILSQVGSVAVKTPPNIPSVIEAQAKFFQYRHLPTSDDYDQGHRLGSERHFTERHERSRPGEGLFSAKVRWGDKQGGYGEHYWDLNHAGHGNNGDEKYGSDSDDGSYHVHDPYDEPSEQSPSYDNDEYDAEKSAVYDDSNRAKRDHPQRKVKEEIIYGQKEPVEEEPQEEQHKKPAKVKRQREQSPSYDNEEYDAETSAVYDDSNRAKRGHPQRKVKEEIIYGKKKVPVEEEEEDKKPAKVKRQRKRNHEVLPKENEETSTSNKRTEQETREDVHEQQNQSQYVSRRQPDPERYVPYEGGAGIRQHQQPEVTAASSVPRLFLEPSTGHVVDRATGQAYVLQPIKAY